MIGWLVVWKCLVACLFFESSQQPTCPQVRQRRRCTQLSPIFKQSSHPLALGVTSRIWSRWPHCCAICFCSPSLMLLPLFARITGTPADEPFLSREDIPFSLC